MRFLLDENLSPETAAFLAQRFGFDVAMVGTASLRGASDAQVVAIAQREDRVLITLDLDLGEIYHGQKRGQFGVIVLRLGDQTPESVQRLLGLFFAAPPSEIDLRQSLVVLEPGSVRVVRPDSQ